MNNKITERRFFVLGIIIALVISLGVYLGIKLGGDFRYPFILSLGILALSVGIFNVALAIKWKSALYIVLGGLGLIFGLAIVLLLFTIIKFYVIAIISAVLLIVLFLLVYMFYVPSTHLEFDNHKPGYKTYRQKKEEEENKANK